MPVLHRRRTLPLFLALALALTAAACSGDGTAGADRSTTTTTPPTTTTAPADPFAVPEEIDAAYVERVTNELFRIEGETYRILLTEGSLTPTVEARFRAVHETEMANTVLTATRQGLARGFPNLERPATDITVSIDDVTEASAECIVAHGVIKVDGVWKDSSDFSGVVSLWRADDELDPDGLNPTPWALRVFSRTELYRPDLDGCDAR